MHIEIEIRVRASAPTEHGRSGDLFHLTRGETILGSQASYGVKDPELPAHEWSSAIDALDRLADNAARDVINGLGVLAAADHTSMMRARNAANPPPSLATPGDVSF